MVFRSKAFKPTYCFTNKRLQHIYKTWIWTCFHSLERNFGLGIQILVDIYFYGKKDSIYKRFWKQLKENRVLWILSKIWNFSKYFLAILGDITTSIENSRLLQCTKIYFLLWYVCIWDCGRAVEKDKWASRIVMKWLSMIYLR